MIAPPLATASVSRAARLRAATHACHEKLDACIMQYRPFESAERYGRFLLVQYPFMHRVAPIYAHPALHAFIPDLKERDRFPLIALDLQDLGLHAADMPESPSVSLPEALGWLYVAEGSNLGAAFLLKHAAALGFDAQKGARHLAGHPDGRGLNWRNFVTQFDAIPLPEEDEKQAEAAAMAAFNFVHGRVVAVYEAFECPPA